MHMIEGAVEAGTREPHSLFGRLSYRRGSCFQNNLDYKVNSALNVKLDLPHFEIKCIYSDDKIFVCMRICRITRLYYTS